MQWEGHGAGESSTGLYVLKGAEETAHLCPRKVLGEEQEDVNVVDMGEGEKNHHQCPRIKARRVVKTNEKKQVT